MTVRLIAILTAGQARRLDPPVRARPLPHTRARRCPRDRVQLGRRLCANPSPPPCYLHAHARVRRHMCAKQPHITSTNMTTGSMLHVCPLPPPHVVALHHTIHPPLLYHTAHRTHPTTHHTTHHATHHGTITPTPLSLPSSPSPPLPHRHLWQTPSWALSSPSPTHWASRAASPYTRSSTRSRQASCTHACPRRKAERSRKSVGHTQRRARARGRATTP